MKNRIAFAFECSIISGKLTLNPEADEIKYFNVVELPINMSEKQKERIKDCLESKEIVFRNQ